MLSFAINVMFLASVLGQGTDPTKVCLPDTFQSNIYSLDSHNAGLIAFDFPNDALAVRSSNGLRSVYNLSDYSMASINETDGDCKLLPSNDMYKIFGFQCLPATTVLISNATRHIGLIDSDSLFLGWRVPFPGVGAVTLALTTTDPAIPILREFKTSPDSEPHIVLFFNAKLGVDDKSIFTVPDDCTPATIVG
ncbi:hypothetical protein BsWGS_04497 [Bradybaena similaris]